MGTRVNRAPRPAAGVEEVDDNKTAAPGLWRTPGAGVAKARKRDFDFDVFETSVSACRKSGNRRSRPTKSATALCEERVSKPVTRRGAHERGRLAKDGAVHSRSLTRKPSVAAGLKATSKPGLHVGKGADNAARHPINRRRPHEPDGINATWDRKECTLADDGAEHVSQRLQMG